MIRFTVPSVPVAQPRQRHRVITSHGRTSAHNYTPSKHPVQTFKATIQMAARSAYQGPPLDGPVLFRVAFFLPRPGRLRWKRREMPAIWHDSKPDVDNLAKSVQDALTAIIWHDDSQIAASLAEKWYTAGDDQPRVEVIVRPLTGAERSKWLDEGL